MQQQSSPSLTRSKLRKLIPHTESCRVPKQLAAYHGRQFAEAWPWTRSPKLPSRWLLPRACLIGLLLWSLRSSRSYSTVSLVKQSLNRKLSHHTAECSANKDAHLPHSSLRDLDVVVFLGESVFACPITVPIGWLGSLTILFGHEIVVARGCCVWR